jgi:hypothetical protein
MLKPHRKTVFQQGRPYGLICYNQHSFGIFFSKEVVADITSGGSYLR